MNMALFGCTLTGVTGVLHASVQSGAFLCIFARFCAFLCVSVRLFLPKWPAEKRKMVYNRAKMCKKRFYAIPPLVIPPFACHRIVGSPNFARLRQSSHEGAPMLLVHPGTCLRNVHQENHPFLAPRRAVKLTR